MGVEHTICIKYVGTSLPRLGGEMAATRNKLEQDYRHHRSTSTFCLIRSSIVYSHQLYFKLTALVFTRNGDPATKSLPGAHKHRPLAAKHRAQRPKQDRARPTKYHSRPYATRKSLSIHLINSKLKLERSAISSTA
jgi:hypothetical protein